MATRKYWWKHNYSSFASTRTKFRRSPSRSLQKRPYRFLSRVYVYRWGENDMWLGVGPIV